MKKNKILIICGGGVFGIIPAYFLHCLGCKNLNTLIDIYGGTSVGSILTMAYACNNSPTYVFNTFKNESKRIFSWSWRRLIPFGSKFNNKHLIKMMKKFAPYKYGQIKKPVIVPVTDFIDNKIKVYDNITSYDDMNKNAWEIPVESASAPTYFPVFNGKIDGGLSENMPILSTTFAMRDKGNIPFENMDIFVIGTGFRDKNIKPDDTRYWTAAHWLKKLIPILTEANESSSYFWSKQLPFNSVTIFNPIKISGDIDDADNIENLINSCRGYESKFETAFNEFLNK